MSCRVFKKNIEIEVLRILGEIALSRDLNIICVQFNLSERNGIVKEFLDKNMSLNQLTGEYNVHPSRFNNFKDRHRMQNIEIRLIEIFSSVLDKEFNIEDVSTISKNDLQEWDSIANVILYQRVTIELGIDLKTDEFLMCESFNDIVTLITNVS